MREEEDKHAEMIHFLRNNTQLSRFARTEVRDFIERLETEGYEIAKKAEAGFPMQVVDPTVIHDHVEPMVTEAVEAPAVAEVVIDV